MDGKSTTPMVNQLDSEGGKINIKNSTGLLRRRFYKAVEKTWKVTFKRTDQICGCVAL